MEQVICGASAFELYRIPPQVTLLLPEFPRFSTRRQRSAISRSNDLGPWLNLPIHTLCDSPSARTRSSAIKDHVWSGDLPSSAIWENNKIGVRYTSPLMTLLTLAPLVSVHRLTMAAYELCGTFAVYSPTKEMQRALDHLRNQRLAWPGGWRQVYDHAGKPTSLWHRDPLVTLHELRGFCEESKGMHGHRQLCQAAHAVTGVTASPLEVQASMLLNLTRRRGGEGLGPIVNNHPITLNRDARILAGQSTCYADILFPECDTHPAIDIELQGHMIHDGGRAGGIDSNRMLGLKRMGIEVIMVTAEQLYNPGRFHRLSAHLSSLLGIRRKAKSAGMEAAERDLRCEVLSNWEQLLR